MSYKAWYNQEADYNTNAKSYMDYLARHNKFMKVLVEDYEVFKEILIEEFKQFQLNTDETIDSFQSRLDNIQQEMTDLFIEWTKDGTLDTIINENIFSQKVDRSELEPLNTDINHLEEKIDKQSNDLKTRSFNVLHAPDSLTSAKGDGITDDSQAINALIDYVGEMGGGEIIFPNKRYALSSPIIINHDRVILTGKRAELMTTSHFNTSTHKGIIEALTTKNGVVLRPSLQEVIISGFVINGENKTVNGVALSGFTRGCILENNYIHNCYHGIAISGSWSSRISNNLVYNCRMGGLVLGTVYDIEIDSNMNYTDNGADHTIRQEGYEYTNGNVSIQCNAMEIIHNTLRSNKNNLMVHFGNANVFTNNTLENASNANMIISAMESGSFIGNYMEASRGSVFGRTESGAVRNTVWNGNYYNNENFFFLGFMNNDFTKNEIIGSYNVVHHTYQRVNGNITQLPNPAYKADSMPFKADYTAQRDNIVTDDIISHGGKLTTALEDSKLVTGFEMGDYTTNPMLLKPTQQFHGYKLGESKVVSQSAESIASVTRSGFVIVEGSNTEQNTERFIDILLVISSGTVTTVSSNTRGSNMADRNYSMSNDDLMLSFGSKSYDVKTTTIGL